MMSGLFFAGTGQPITKPEDVIPFLGKGPLHWKKGRSAFETAQSWFAAAGLPPAIQAIFDAEPDLAGLRLLRAFFERQTQLDDTGRGPSQTDVLAVLEARDGVVVAGIEAKVDETFGPLVLDWMDGSPAKKRRLSRLSSELGISEVVAYPLRYQLLHRTAAALLEARGHGARLAVMLVQSFSPRTIRAGFSDFQAFSRAIGCYVEAPGKLSAPHILTDIQLRLGWTENELSAREVL